MLVVPHLPKPPVPPVAQTDTIPLRPAATPAEAAAAAAETVPKDVPRLKIAGRRVQGSVSLLGARIDDIVLSDYKETLDPGSSDVRLLEPRSDDKPYYVQYGWTAAASEPVKLPDNNTVWTKTADAVSAGHPATLSWDNGAGLTFLITLSVDDDYMFTVSQAVKNDTAQPVNLFPWSRIRRDYKPQVAGYYVLFEGLLGIVDGTLQDVTYDKAKSQGEKKNGIAYDANATGDYVTQDAQTVAPGTENAMTSHLFAGAKLVTMLDRYEADLHIPNFDKAVDFGWFYFLTKPIFYALDFLNGLLGNFGLAIMVFTVFVKGLFFPLANYSYRSMSKMKLLGPRMTALRERYKDEPQRMQQEMMAMYRAEKVNPASGCLPMVVQIPVFFSLYKVIFVTIEMRQAPFFGWIHDLSQVDPTNVFNLFGLIPFDPAAYVPLLHLGLWPLIMGFTMFLQQKMNPPPPDPVQAKLFQFMPIIFTFMMANFPAGLIIYWSWNNTLSVAQQWLIQRSTRLAKPSLARG